MVLIDLASAITMINSLQGTTLPFKRVLVASLEESSDAEMPVKGGDVLGRLPTVFGNISKLCEQVIFVNSICCSRLSCSGLCLSNLSFLWLQAKVLYN